jgi:hypothetical protein
MESEMPYILKNRIYVIYKELKKTKDCHTEIKYRLGKTLNYLAEIFDDINEIT